MRAKIKSVRNINKIFFCIFTYIWKLDIFSTFLNFEEKWFFGYFKSQISKCHKHIKLLTPVLCHKNPSGQNNKLILYFIHYLTPCITQRTHTRHSVACWALQFIGHIQPFWCPVFCCILGLLPWGLWHTNVGLGIFNLVYWEIVKG